MGRGAHDKVNAQVLSGQPRGGVRGDLLEEIELITPDTPDDIGSPAHRRRLAEYARARTARFDVRVEFSAFCGACGHDYDHAHPGGGGCTENGCNCPKYIPGGGSYTDMAGNITVQSDRPPTGDIVEREIVINGLLRHEVCHELYTNPEAFRAMIKELEKLSKNKKEVTASQLKHIWNILEDGMIETREREEMPGSYRFISAMNKIWSRVPRPGEDDEIVEHERYLPLPDGYIPTDADGNELPVVKHPVTGEDCVHIKPGTRLSPWGDKPLDLQQQAQAALLARSVPELQSGEVHPTVAKALEECEEHIDAAVRGNTSDCIARAYAVHAILRKHGLLAEDLTDEEREALEQLYQEMGVDGPSMPQPAPGAEPQPGQQMQPINGMPQGGGGMSKELQQQMGGGGGAPSNEQGDAESGDQMQHSGDDGGGGSQQSGSDQQSGGGGGDEKDAQGDGDEDEGTGGGGAGEEDEAGADGDGKDGDAEGKEGDADGESSEGDGSDGDDADGEDQGQGSSSSGGGDYSENRAVGDGGAGGGGHSAQRPLPKEAVQKSEREGKGSVSDSELEEMKKEAKQNLESDKAQQIEDDMRNIRKGRIEGDQYQFKSNESVVSQGTLADGARQHGEALPDEQGELHSLGRQLAMKLKRIKTEARAPTRRRMTGRLDSRAYSRGLAGDPKIYERKGRNIEMDLEIDVSIDRSGSVDYVQTENQYRMAKMLALASKETKVPMTIYGWDGGWGSNCNHYAFKERHSDDTRAIDSIFQCGGGGTPTAEGVRFARRRLANSKANQKVMVIVTDGGANDIEATREQVQAAKAEGIEVIGLAFGCDKNMMDEQFGPNNWRNIDDYLETPQIVGKLIEETAKKRARRR